MLKNKKLFINQVSYGKWIIEQILSKWTCQFLKILDTILYVVQNIFFGGEKKKCNQKQLGLSITSYSLRGVKYVLTSKHYSFNYEHVIGK